MTQDQIIELAKSVGFWKEHTNTWMCNSQDIEAFAKLIAEQEREKILGVLRRKPDQQIYKVLDEIRSMK